MWARRVSVHAVGASPLHPPFAAPDALFLLGAAWCPLVRGCQRCARAQVPDLKKELENRNLDSNGLKSELIARLSAALTAEGADSIPMSGADAEEAAEEASANGPSDGQGEKRARDEVFRV